MEHYLGHCRGSRVKGGRSEGSLVYLVLGGSRVGD